MSDLSVLAPPPKDKAEQRMYRDMDNIVRKVVVNAAIHRSGSDIMREVYLAGIWHGMKLSGPKPRQPDYLELAPLPKRRGRPRKDNQHGH